MHHAGYRLRSRHPQTRFSPARPAASRPDLAVSGERIAAIGHGLGAGKREIDAIGRIVTPGGVDSHAHIEQLSGGGVMNADTWESATTSAAHGGTTSVIAFAAQHVGKDMRQVVDDYAALARKGAVIDYNYHLIVSDPTEKTLKQDLPALIAEGHASIKGLHDLRRHPPA